MEVLVVGGHGQIGLRAPNTIGVEFDLFEGDVPAREAVRSLSRASAMTAVSD